MPQTNLYDRTGATVGSVDLAEALFAAPVNEAVLHQAVVAQLAGRRTGTHSTKTRGEVRGGGRKPYRQKGTGRARQGSNTSPLMPGGGRAFGPRPHDHRTEMPKGQRRGALVSALSLKAGAGAVWVIEPLAFPEAKTRQMADLLKTLGLYDKKTLLVLDEAAEPVVRSCRNLKNLRMTLAHQVNPHDLLDCETVLVTQRGLERMKEVFVR